MAKRKRRKKSKVYFGKEAQDAIIEYNNTDDPVKKDQIYKDKIEYPFNKLAENIINRFKFPYFYASTKEIQKEVVSYLSSVIHKYEPDKGRAFSYFSVIAKNHLIIENRKKYDYVKSHYSVDHPESTIDVIDEETVDDRDEEMREFTQLMLEFWDNNLTTIFTKQRDQKIADAILTLFRRAGNIENFNKKALYLMIRDQAHVKTQYITNVVNRMSEYMEQMMEEYQRTGIFDTSNIREREFNNR